MSNIEPKMLSQLRVLHILEKYSDADHLLTQKDIADRLEEEFGIEMERKAISKKIANLKEAGYDIRSGKKGCYLNERSFTDAELHFLIDLVMSNKTINKTHSEDLVKKIQSLGNAYFKPQINKIITVGTTDKGDNPALFYNIELIYEAIGNGRQITYDYNLYGEDKKFHRSSTQTVSPYQLLFHNQDYYLMAYSSHHETIVFHKVDHMTNMTVNKEPAISLRNVSGYEKGLPQDYFTAARPYMYSDAPERIEMIVSRSPYIINQIVEWFGKDITISEIKGDQNELRVSLKASPSAMRLWALQYADYVEIIEPYNLRDDIRDSLMFALDKYGR
ncbi:MAG: WYL domain-containing protein [Clostridiales bacterium]|nr:WYL domain-containing protein [Clostridiales bacterium]